MIWLWFISEATVSPLKSGLGFEPDNAVLPHRLIVLRCNLRGRAQFANCDRALFSSCIASFHLFFEFLQSYVSAHWGARVDQRHHLSAL